jgi:hypothetical protein
MLLVIVDVYTFLIDVKLTTTLTLQNIAVARSALALDAKVDAL